MAGGQHSSDGALTDTFCTVDLYGWASGSLDGAICRAHIEDRHLAARLTPSAATCTLCQASSTDEVPIAVPLDEVLAEIANVINFFYTDAESVLSYDDDTHWAEVRDVWDVLEEVCDGVFDDLATEGLYDGFVKALGETQWTKIWADAEADDLDLMWDSFAETVKHECRSVFIAPSNVNGDGALGGGVGGFLAALLPYVDGELDLVTTLTAGTDVFRGRLVESENDIEWTAKELGPAPRDRASASRMSPAGVPMFYASGSVETAVAEIAGHGVKPYALVGRFTSTRPLDVLDLTATPGYPPSLFAPGARSAVRARNFLSSFVHEVTRPVIPDGRVHVEYAPTQVVTEYLRRVPVRRIDGICLPSGPGNNEPTYVFFFGPDAFVEDEEPGRHDIALQIDLELTSYSSPVFTLSPDVGFYQVVRRTEAVKQETRRRQ